MRAALVVAVGLIGLPAGAGAHGPHASPPLVVASTGPLASGAREALSCDGEIYDSVFEYDLCIESRRSAVEQSADGSLGFWLIAMIRAHGATDNGYPEARTYLDRYRERFKALQSEMHAPVVETLCKVLALPCPRGL